MAFHLVTSLLSSLLESPSMTLPLAPFRIKDLGVRVSGSKVGFIVMICMTLPWIRRRLWLSRKHLFPAAFSASLPWRALARALMIAASPRARRGTRYYSGRIRAFAFSSPGPVPVSRRSPNLRRSEAVAYYGVSLSELHGSMVAHWDYSTQWNQW